MTRDPLIKHRLAHGTVADAKLTDECPSGATTMGHRPYKCPCCDGYGKRQVIRAMMTNINFEPCGSCGGTGVVWG